MGSRTKAKTKAKAGNKAGATLSEAWTSELEDYVAAAAWSPDGSAVAAGSLAGDVVVFDAETGDAQPALTRHPMGVLSVAWSASGQFLATGGQDGVARVHNRVEGQEVAIGLNGWVSCLAWSPTRSLLAIAAGREVRIVDVLGATFDAFADHTSTVTSLAWSVDGALLGVGCYGGVSWFEPGGGRDPVHRFDWKGSILTMTVAPNGQWLAAGNQDNSVHVWALWSGEDMEMVGYPAKVQHLSWDGRSRHLAVGNLDELMVWSFAGKGPVGSTPKSLNGIERRISALRYQHDGALLASGTADGSLALWNPHRKDKSLVEIEVDSEISQLAWSSDDTHLLAATAGGRLGVYRARPG